MPITAQPPGRRGTVGHPYSALNLRLVLAMLGALMSAALGVLCVWAGQPLAAWALLALTVVGVVDIGVILLRRRARRRVDGSPHSLFE